MNYDVVVHKLFYFHNVLYFRVKLDIQQGGKWELIGLFHTKIETD